MHRKTSKRSIPLTEKVKHPQPSSSMTVNEIEENGIKNHCPMVSSYNSYTKTAAGNIPHREYVNRWPKLDPDDSWSWDRRSSGTSISWPEEMEEVATKKVIEQWEAVQRTLYDENDQVTNEALRTECIQWRTERPHLRIIGKGLQKYEDTGNKTIEDPPEMRMTKNNNNSTTVEEMIEEHNVEEDITLEQVQDDSPKGEYRKEKEKEVLDLILDYVCSELLKNNEDEECLSKNLDTVLRITPAPTYSGRNNLRNHNTSNDFVTPNHRRIKLYKDNKRERSDALENSEHLPEVRKNNYHVSKNDKVFVRGSMTSISARRQRDIRDIAADSILLNNDRLYTPQLPRNALGTVFTEKIIVSPVPFATSTKESFSTLKSTPLGSMRLSIESSLAQRSARSVNYGSRVTPVRRAGLLQIPQVHSAWQAPVCPTVWPKNVKLAPIDITRLPSSRRRSLASSSNQPRRSRNSLSPIPREIMPVSPLANRESDVKSLEIHGKQIEKQKSRISVTSAGWDMSPRNMKKLGKKILNNQR